MNHQIPKQAKPRPYQRDAIKAMSAGDFKAPKGPKPRPYQGAVVEELNRIDPDTLARQLHALACAAGWALETQVIPKDQARTLDFEMQRASDLLSFYNLQRSQAKEDERREGEELNFSRVKELHFPEPLPRAKRRLFAIGFTENDFYGYAARVAYIERKECVALINRIAMAIKMRPGPFTLRDAAAVDFCLKLSYELTHRGPVWSAKK